MLEEIKGKNVFVTGADGFIGSHLVEKLVKQGANVRALVYYNSWNNLGWLADIPGQIIENLEIVRGDVRDAEFIRKYIAGCEYVFHLSSLIAIPYSYYAPRSYIDTNVTGALNVLQGCRESDVLARLLHVSTSEVYGTAQYVPIDELHPLVGQSPYSASKIAADKLAESYHKSFKLPVVTARPFNTFGPRQTARAVIPTIISQLCSGVDTLKLGALTPTRDFNFVKDTVQGMINLALCPAAEGETVNIGTGQEWSIQQTAEMIMDYMGKHIQIDCEEQRIRPKDSEVNRLLAETSKMYKLTSWKSEYNFEDGLKQTIEWIEKNINHFDAATYSL